MPDQDSAAERLFGNLTWQAVERPGDGGQGEGPAAGGSARASGATPRTTASGHERADRAAQFMPFAALRGYYELLRKQTLVPEPRHELTDEEALALSQVVQRVRRRQIVRVVYYDEDAYVTLTGCVAHIDLAARELVVVKTHIALDDIRDLQIVSEN